MNHATQHDVPIGDVFEPNDTNPNVMPREDFDLLVEAMRRSGFVQPILVRPRPDGGVTVIDGVHRVAVARELGMASVPVVEVICTDEEAVLLRIAMNKLRGELNLATVASQLAELRAGGMAMEELVAAGYTSTGIDELLAMVAPDDPEQALAQMGSADEAEADAKVADNFQQLQLDLRITRREFLKVKRRLKKLGDGDMGDGLLKLLNEEEES